MLINPSQPRGPGSGAILSQLAGIGPGAAAAFGAGAVFSQLTNAATVAASATIGAVTSLMVLQVTSAISTIKNAFVSSITSMVGIIKDSLSGVASHARSVLNVQQFGGYSAMQASGLVNILGAAGVPTEGIQSMFANPMSSLRASLMSGMMGMPNPANDPQGFLMAGAGRFQQAQRGGPMANMMFQNQLNAMAPGAAQSLIPAFGMGTQRLERLMTMQKAFAPDPGAMLKVGQDIAETTLMFKTFGQNIKMIFVEALAPIVQRTMTRLFNLLVGNKEKIISAVSDVGIWIADKLPVLLMRGISSFLRIGGEFLGTLSESLPGILKGLNGFTDGLRHVAATIMAITGTVMSLIKGGTAPGSVAMDLATGATQGAAQDPSAQPRTGPTPPGHTKSGVLGTQFDFSGSEPTFLQDPLSWIQKNTTDAMGVTRPTTPGILEGSFGFGTILKALGRGGAGGAVPIGGLTRKGLPASGVIPKSAPGLKNMPTGAWDGVAAAAKRAAPWATGVAAAGGVAAMWPQLSEMGGRVHDRIGGALNNAESMYGYQYQRAMNSLPGGRFGDKDGEKQKMLGDWSAAWLKKAAQFEKEADKWEKDSAIQRALDKIADNTEPRANAMMITGAMRDMIARTNAYKIQDVALHLSGLSG